eukprot:c16519_g1_i1.p1 GENE.c16519_g1_i1~~c16519_g1_i1.p1  ORF type:complete len:362 (-),score=132.69 c16519_g1_i1:16-1101(-)
MFQNIYKRNIISRNVFLFEKSIKFQNIYHINKIGFKSSSIRYQQTEPQPLVVKRGTSPGCDNLYPSLRHPSTASTKALTNEEVKKFHENGFVFRKGMFSLQEMDLLFQASKSDEISPVLPMLDSEGRVSSLSLMNHVGNNIYGAFARCARIVDSAEKILGDEVYHYHSKVMKKEPRVGGAWDWHQDYGYWYNNGVALPDIVSVMIAIDRHTLDNGCLQVLSGSHKMGRVNHVLVGDQAGAEPERIDQAIKLFGPAINIECEPGDCLFFHSNLFHGSPPNLSDNPRWSLISCYNTKKNDPYREHHHPCYTPMERWPDDCIIKSKGKRAQVGDGTLWLTPETTAGTIKSDTGEKNTMDAFNKK